MVDIEDLTYPSEDAHTTLINITNTDPEEMDFYIAHAHDSYDLDDSPLRNPFEETEMDQYVSAENHMVYLYRRYLTDEEFRKFLHSLEGKTLGCLCYPDRCHGEEIVDLLNAHHNEGVEGVLQTIEEDLENADTEKLGGKGLKEYHKAQEALEDLQQDSD